MKVSAWIGIFAATGLLALGACSSDDDSSGTGGSAGSGTGGSAGSGTGGSAGSGTGGSAGSTGGSAGSAGGDGGLDCTACAQANCATELGACQANADCLAILTCSLQCTDDPCIQQCYDDNPGGQGDWDAVEQCAATNCPQCGL